MFKRITSYLCLVLIAACIIFYSIFGSSFAEINIQLSFLDFPIFVGELVMIFCLFVLFIHLFIEPVRWKRWRAWVLVYFSWVMFKAAEGYLNGGAYALRNAALFYYPIFAFLTGYFLGKVKIIHNRGLFSFSAIFLAVMAIISTQVTLFIAALCFAVGISHRWTRWVFVGSLVCFFFFQFRSLSGGRAYLAGVVAGIFFLVWYGTQILRVPFRKQVASVSIIIFLFFICLWVWGDRNAITSLVTPSRIIEDFLWNNEIVEQRKDTFVPLQLKTQLYHKNSKDLLLAHKSLLSKEAPQAVVTVPQRHSEPQAVVRNLAERSVERNLAGKDISQATPSQSTASQATPSQTVVPELRQDSKDTFRNLGVAYVNAVFRLFLWRDMIQEFIKYRPVFGFSFGRPQRSISLEILNWAQIEWLRDGWITPHNSFLHLIYRGGIIGLVVIGFIIFFIVMMTKDFLRAGSWQGGLLISALVYWIVNAQFGVILELPYNAIVFWTLFGITWVYRNQLRGASINQ